MLQHAGVVIESEQQRTDGLVGALVPTEACDYALGCAGMLHLDHGPLAGLIDALRRLGNYAVEARALEVREPLARLLAVGSGGGEIERRLGSAEQPLEFLPALCLGHGHEIPISAFEKIEGHERCRG